MDIKTTFNFKQISKQISSSGNLIDLNWQSLATNNYDLVINLLPDKHKYAAGNEKEHIEKLAIQYQHIPVIWQNPLDSDYRRFEKIMKLNEGKKVHIHCAANYRATGFHAIYAYKNLGWSGNELYELISEVWQLADYPIWEKFVMKYVKR